MRVIVLVYLPNVEDFCRRLAIAIIGEIELNRIDLASDNRSINMMKINAPKNFSMTLPCKAAIAFIWFALPILAWSGELAGLWEEYDDNTGSLSAMIRIKKLPDDTYEGRIEKIFPDTVENSTLVCTHCDNDLRNRPLLGLRILTGMKRLNERIYEGGKVLDPDDGKVYSCRIRLSEDGNVIEVTGFLSLNWIGQSEIWRRAKK